MSNHLPAWQAAPPPEPVLDDPALRPQVDSAILDVRGLSLWYGSNQALFDVTLLIPPRRITAFIGPSGCGKSTLLRCFNRLNDLVDGVRIAGSILFEERDIRDLGTDVNLLRKRVGMVFQKSNPFPKSIYENIAYGPRIHGVRERRALDEIVERSLRAAALWDEVKDRLGDSALALSGGQQQRLCIARAIAVEPEVILLDGLDTRRIDTLSGGQQQRLCIARAIAVEPEVILLDEPCSALDPVATAKIEELMIELKERYTLIVVTHNMQQASRVSDLTAFLYLGRLIEYQPTERLFIKPLKKQTEEYITGRFG